MDGWILTIHSVSFQICICTSEASTIGLLVLLASNPADNSFILWQMRFTRGISRIGIHTAPVPKILNLPPTRLMHLNSLVVRTKHSVTTAVSKLIQECQKPLHRKGIQHHKLCRYSCFMDGS